MVVLGLVEEVRGLVDNGFHLNLSAMSGIGYKQIGMFLSDELTLAAAIQQIKFATHRFVRHQYNWFRLSDEGIKWFDVKGDVEAEITAEVAEFISDEKGG